MPQSMQNIRQILTQPTNTLQDLDQLINTLYDVGKGSDKIWPELTPDIDKLLSHPNEEVRATAIRVLAYDWGLPGYEMTAKKMFYTDPDPEVRQTALMAWASYQAGTDNKEVMLELYNFLMDENQDKKLRGAAYLNLLSVSKLPRSQWPKNPGLAANGVLESLVDWDLAKKLCTR